MAKISDIVKKAKLLGQEAIALTDHGTMSSVYTFYQECKKQGIKPILGLEAYFVPDVGIKERKSYHLILLAKNDIGYHNLLKLDKLAYENLYYKPRLDFHLLSLYHEGIICSSACIGSILNTELGYEYAKKYQSIFGDDFFLEIQANTMPEQQIYNEKILKMSKELKIPVIVTNDSHYINKDDAYYQRLWVGVNKNADEYYSVEDFYIKSEQETVDILALQGIDYGDIQKAIDNTHLIANQCEVNINVSGDHFPVFQTDNPVKLIAKICDLGWQKKIVGRVPNNKLKIYQERLEHELRILEKCNYVNYMLITYDILDWCEKNGILTGVGRGSAAGSLVAYLMNITKIDPIKHNLLFSRFVNEFRVTAADIDNDIDKDYRDKVIEYVRQRYGYVFNIRTFNTLGAKGALQRGGQALRLDPQYVIRMSKDIESLDDVQGNEELINVARHFEGLIHAFGCHASAVLVFPDDPSNYCPIEKQGNVFLASYDYHDLEKMGLLKLDLLGLANLTVIRKTLKMIGKPIDVMDLSLDDPKIYELYAHGLTDSIFQCESHGMKHLAKQVGVSNFEDLIALVALFRPGPLDSGMAEHFIEGKNDSKKIDYLHPDLEPVLKDTYGVIIYQEQVMQIVQIMARMDSGEADNFRKIIGRKELDKIEAIVKEFINRAIDNGYDKRIANEIGRQIKACGRYIFNRSHAASYAYTSFITAYLKCYYPLEYMCSVLDNEMGDIDKVAQYIDEAKRMGIRVLSPNINKSGIYFTPDANRSIIYGLGAIKGIGINTVEKIILHHPYSSFNDFMRRCPVDRGTVEALIKAGAFTEDKDHLISSLDWYCNSGKRIQECQIKIREYLIKGNEKRVTEWQKKLSEAKATSPQYMGKIDWLEAEKEVLGLYLSGSPLSPYIDYLKQNSINHQQFEQVEVKAKYSGEIIIGGLIIEVKHIQDRNGRSMGFLSVQTIDGGLINITLFADVWEIHHLKAKKGHIVRVKGVKDGNGKMIGNAIQVLKIE